MDWIYTRDFHGVQVHCGFFAFRRTDMAVTFSPAVKLGEPVQLHCKPVTLAELPKRDRRNERGSRKPEAPEIKLDQTGALLRAKHVQSLLGGLSHQTFYRGIREGRYPPPDTYDYPARKVGARGKAYWITDTIRQHLEGVKAKSAEAKAKPGK